MNQAVWLDAAGSAPRVGVADTPEPGPQQVLIQVRRMFI